MAKSGWTKRPTEFALEIEDAIGAKLIELADQAARDIIYRSPKDTSRFLSNHNFSVNTPNESYDPDKRDHSRSDTLAQARLAIAKLKPGDVFYAVNTTPYGKYLEWGHSGQAQLGIYNIAFNNLKERS